MDSLAQRLRPPGSEGRLVLVTTGAAGRGPGVALSAGALLAAPAAALLPAARALVALVAGPGVVAAAGLEALPAAGPAGLRHLRGGVAHARADLVDVDLEDGPLLA